MIHTTQCQDHETIKDISKNYYMRPERPVLQTLGTLKTSTSSPDATSARRYVRALPSRHPAS